jgi:hypothetical protein
MPATAMDSGSRITGGGSGYAAILAHAGGVLRRRALYGMELGSVTLKRIGFFCFPSKHSTHGPRASALAAQPAANRNGWTDAAQAIQREAFQVLTSKSLDSL